MTAVIMYEKDKEIKAIRSKILSKKQKLIQLKTINFPRVENIANLTKNVQKYNMSKVL